MLATTEKAEYRRVISQQMLYDNPNMCDNGYPREIFDEMTSADESRPMEEPTKAIRKGCQGLLNSGFTRVPFDTISARKWWHSRKLTCRSQFSFPTREQVLGFIRRHHYQKNQYLSRSNRTSSPLIFIASILHRAFARSTSVAARLSSPLPSYLLIRMESGK